MYVKEPICLAHPEAIEISRKILLFAPGKAANAGGVGVSGLEMTQNSMKLRWPAEEVDKRLHEIMDAIHESCVRYGKHPMAMSIM